MPNRGRVRFFVVLALLAGLLAPLGLSPAEAQAPPAPSNLTPDGGSFNTNPTLGWDAVPGVTTYRVEYSTSPTFTPLLPGSGTTFGTKYTPTTQLPNGTIHWRVRANQPASTEWASAQFTVGRAGPVLTAPIGGVELEFPAGTTTFSWEPVPGASDYILQHDDAQDFIGAEEITTPTHGAILAGTPPFGRPNYWRVKARFPGGAESDWSVHEEGANNWYTLEWTDEPGKGRPTLIAPPAQVQGQPAPELTDVELSWQPVLGAGSYEVEVNSSNQFSGVMWVDTITYGTSYQPDMTLPNGSYHWRVRPRSANGQLGHWSDVRTFTRKWPSTASGLPGLTNPPTLLLPLDGAAISSPATFTWKPVDHASHYLVQMGSDPNFSPGTFSECRTVNTELSAYSPIIGGSVPGGCNVFNPTTGAPAGSYWRVAAVDNPRGVLGIFSETRSFTYTPHTIGSFAGFTPVTYVSPPDCAIPCDTEYQSTPTLSWDPVVGVSHYLVYVAIDQSFTSVVRSYRVPASDAPHLVLREELPNNNANEAYYWHVRPCQNDTTCALDPQGQLDPPRSAFQKGSNPVVLVSPADGTPVTTSPRFVWEDFLLDSSTGLSARNYRIQVSTIDTFVNTVENRTVDQTFFSPWDRTYPEGPLYWRVRAIDDSGNELEWSETRQVIYSSTPPTLASGSAETGVPLFAWEPVPYAATYQIELYKNGDQPLAVANRIDNRSTAFTNFASHLSLAPGTYAWRVRRDDGQGRDGPWSDPPSTFVIPNTAIVQQLGPVNGALFDDMNFVYSWDQVPGASQYRFRRSANMSFTTVADTVTTAMTAYAPTQNYATGTWYWMVEALNPTGQVIATSGVRSIVYDARDLASAPTSVGVTNGRGSVTVTWQAPTHAGVPAYTEYIVRVSPAGLERVVPAVAGSVQTATFHGLINGQTANISIRARIGADEGAEATINGFPNGCLNTPFSDVLSSSTFCEYITWMYTTEISTGTVMPNQSVQYKPADPVSRQAMAAFLYRFETMQNGGVAPVVDMTQRFADVPPSHPFYPTIQWMGESGLSTGTPNPAGGLPLYKPTDKVSRQAMAAFLHRYAGNVAPTLPTAFFADVAPGNTFYPDVQWMAETGLSVGTPNPPGCVAGVSCGKPLYKPVDPVSRQAMAAFLFRFDESLP